MSEFQENISRTGTWLRLVYMLLFALVFWVCKLVLLVLAVIQFLSLLLSGEKNEELDRFARSFSQYLGQVTAYLSLASDERPFPFADWPVAADDDDAILKAASEASSAAQEPAPVNQASPAAGGTSKADSKQTGSKKTAAKKKTKATARKTASKKTASKKKTGGKA